jgi:hypothetical protein
MRRVAILMAGAALAAVLVVPTMAQATGKSSTSADRGTEISAQGIGLDDQISAQGKGHGRGHGKGYSKGRGRHGHHHGYRHGHRYGFHRYGYYGYPGFGYPGYGYGGYGYGGYWRGGFGCNFDYPCGPPFDEQCRSFRGAPSADPKCQAQQTAPAPGQSAQPAPDASSQPAPAPAPAQGDTQPRPY